MGKYAILVVVEVEEPCVRNALEPGTELGLAVRLAEGPAAERRNEVVDADVLVDVQEVLADFHVQAEVIQGEAAPRTSGSTMTRCVRGLRLLSMRTSCRLQRQLRGISG